MKLASLALLVRRDLGRTRGALVTSGFGIAAGTAALVFFAALWIGVRAVLFGQVFPLDRIEIEPPKSEDPGLLGLVLGAAPPPGISDEEVKALSSAPGVKKVYPKLRFAFPASGRGGREIFGHDVGTSELMGDGIDPSLVKDEPGLSAFVDPMESPGPACENDAGCAGGQYCEKPSGEAAGRCSAPVPVIVSRYLIEIFDKSIAPAHNLPPVGKTMVARAEGVTFTVRLGESLLGKSKGGSARTVKAKLVGISPRAVDIGVTLPLPVVARWNKEFAGPKAAERVSSVVVEVRDANDASGVLAAAGKLGLAPKDSRARDVSVLVNGVSSLLTLVAVVILIVSASNIAYTFRVLVTERRAEIALYRAIGATAADMRAWMIALAAVVGVAGGGAGLVIARVIAFIADRLAKTSLPDFPFKPESFFGFPWWLAAGALGFGALFAVLGALGPSLRAAKVEPAAALSGV